MLTSFFIEGFRLFSRLEIEDLSRVNLIVGKNNTGKSALLEAIEVFVSEASIKALNNQIASRQENWSLTLNQENGIADHAVRHLFYGHRFEIGASGIKLGTSEIDGDFIELYVAALKIEEREEGGGFVRNEVDVGNVSGDDMTELDISLMVRYKEKSRRLLSLERDIERDAALYARNDILRGSQKTPVQVVPTRNMTESEIAALWDKISLTDLEREVVSGLQIIEPRITGIGFVEGTSRSTRNVRIPIVKIDGEAEPLTLKSMGDGMTRLLHIVIGLVSAQKGLLLVDEFENGIHWAVQPKMWDTVFRLAEKLDVQVFATSHSRDCISGFEAAWKNREAAGAFFRMDSQDGEIKVISYTCETLSDALETDVEVR